jgi:pyridoxamine 5'-phosphate oxidase
MTLMNTADDPIERFADLFRRAAHDAPFDHTAASLATATAAGLPSVRIVLVRTFDERGFDFFTNYDSQKGRELAANPQGSLCFYWPWIDEQVRAQGAVSRLDPAESDAYFASRPRGSQIGAWASRQSAPLGSRAELEGRLREVELQFAGRPVPRPPNWGGYRLVPEQVEFWRAGEFRLHDRWLYTRTGDRWSVVTLYP